MAQTEAFEYMIVQFSTGTDWRGLKSWECLVIAPDGSVSMPLSAADGTAIEPSDGPEMQVALVEQLNHFGARGWSVTAESSLSSPVSTGWRYLLSRPKATFDV